MKKKISWPYTLIAPIGIIISQLFILASTNTKSLGIVCGIIIGMQMMLIIDSFIDKNKKENL